MTSPITGHRTGPNSEQPFDLILAQSHQLIPLLAVVTSYQPITGGQHVRHRDSEIDADGNGVLQIEKCTMPTIKPAANCRRGHIDDLACRRVRQTMAFQNGSGCAFSSNHIGPSGIFLSLHGAPPLGARARDRGYCQI